MVTDYLDGMAQVVAAVFLKLGLVIMFKIMKIMHISSFQCVLPSKLLYLKLLFQMLFAIDLMDIYDNMCKIHILNYN